MKKIKGLSKKQISPEMALTYVEIVFYISIFLIILKVLSLIDSSFDSSKLPPELFKFSVIISHFGLFYGGMITVTVMTLAAFIFLNKEFKPYIVKAYIVNLVLTLISMNFALVSKIIKPEAVDGTVFFSLFVAYSFPIGVAIYFEKKAKKKIVKDMIRFALLILAATLPRSFQEGFSADSIVRSFMDMAVIYFAGFFVCLALIFSDNERTLGDKFVKYFVVFTSLAVMLALYPLFQVIPYLFFMFLGNFVDTQSVFGITPVMRMKDFSTFVAAPFHMIYIFIKDYINFESPKDLYESVLFFLAIASTSVTAIRKDLEPKERRGLGEINPLKNNMRIFEIAGGVILTLFFLSQPLLPIIAPSNFSGKELKTKILWKHKTDNHMTMKALQDGNYVYVAEYGEIFILNKNTGKETGRVVIHKFEDASSKNISMYNFFVKKDIIYILNKKSKPDGTEVIALKSIRSDSVSHSKRKPNSRDIKGKLRKNKYKLLWKSRTFPGEYPRGYFFTVNGRRFSLLYDRIDGFALIGLNHGDLISQKTLKFPNFFGLDVFNDSRFVHIYSKIKEGKSFKIDLKNGLISEYAGSKKGFMRIIENPSGRKKALQTNRGWKQDIIFFDGKTKYTLSDKKLIFKNLINFNIRDGILYLITKEKVFAFNKHNLSIKWIHDPTGLFYDRRKFIEYAFRSDSLILMGRSDSLGGGCIRILDLKNGSVVFDRVMGLKDNFILKLMFEKNRLYISEKRKDNFVHFGLSVKRASKDE